MPIGYRTRGQDARALGDFANQFGQRLINVRARVAQARRQKDVSDYLGQVEQEYSNAIATDPTPENIYRRAAIARGRAGQIGADPLADKTINRFDEEMRNQGARIAARRQNVQTMDVDYLENGLPKTVQRGGLTYRQRLRRNVTTGEDIPNSTFFTKDDDQTYSPKVPRGTDDPNIQRKYTEDINRFRNQVAVWENEIRSVEEELAAIPKEDEFGGPNPEAKEKRADLRSLRQKLFEAQGLLGGAEDNARNAGIRVDYSGVAKKGNNTTPRRNREGLSPVVTAPDANYKTGGIQIPLRPEESQQPKQSAVTTQDQEAINWARQNPGDPRAAKILKLHGLK